MTATKAQTKFWNWFIQHEAMLFDFDPRQEAARERIFDEFAKELQKVDPDLAFEFGPNEPTRELVISAGGIRRAFPSVVSLVGVAPVLGRWKVIAFRPRRLPNVVEFHGKRIDPRDVQFSLLDNGETAGIYLFLPGFQESDSDLKQIGYLLLDQTLGEYDVESRLGLIKMLSPQTPTDLERYPLSALPTLFDELVSRLEGHSGRSPN
jgi:hypothetical protein